jgi:hypothetical protein
LILSTAFFCGSQFGACESSWFTQLKTLISKLADFFIASWVWVFHTNFYLF